MAEGLKLVIGADIKQAEQAVKTLTKDVQNSAGKIETSYKRTFSSVTASVAKLPPAARPAINAISKLGDSIETLRAKILARQAFIITEKDISKIAIYNAEIRELQAEMTRVGNAGKAGFDNLGNAVTKASGSFNVLATGAQKSFSALRFLANVIPGLGIGGLIFGLFEVTKSMLGFGDSTEDTKKKLEDFNRALKLQSDLFDRNISRMSFATKLQLEYAKAAGATDQLLNATSVAGLSKQLSAFTKREFSLRQTIQNELRLYDQQIEGIESTQKAIAFFESRGLEQTVSTLKEILSVQKSSEEAKNSVILANAELRVRKADEERSELKKISDKSADDLKKFVDKAKQLASELEKIGFIQPQFSFFDSLPEQLEKAKKVFADFNSRNLKLNKDFFKIEPTFSEPSPESIRAALSPIEEMIRAGVLDLPPLPLEVTVSDNFAKNANTLRDFQKAFSDIGRNLPAINLEDPEGFNFNVLLETLRKFFGAAQDVTKEGLQGMAVDFKKGVDSINNIIKGLAVEGISSFGAALGTALAGGNVKDVFTGFLNIVADGLSAIGKQMIALSPVIAALQAALKSLNPAALLPAGIALVAIGAALRQTVSKGVTGFAAGGLVSGPTLGLVGEGVGTSRSNPEVIAPLDKLKSMLSDLGGGQVQRVMVTGRLRGQDIVLQNARTNRSQRRLGG